MRAWVSCSQAYVLFCVHLGGWDGANGHASLGQELSVSATWERHTITPGEPEKHSNLEGKEARRTWSREFKLRWVEIPARPAAAVQECLQPQKMKPSLLTTEVLIHPALSGMQLNSHLLNHKSSNQCNSTVFPHISCSITLASSLLWQEEAKPEFRRGSTNMQVLPI